MTTPPLQRSGSNRRVPVGRVAELEALTASDAMPQLAPHLKAKIGSHLSDPVKFSELKPISYYAKRAVALVAVLVSVACTVGAADDTLPLVVIDHVPLPDAIRNLSRQSNLNYILDPRVPGSDFGPGRLAPTPSVTARWTNVTAQAALTSLLKEHKLTMVANPATTVTRIAPANLDVKPVTTSRVGTNTGSVIPSLVMDSVSLTEAITKLAGAARLTVALDPKLSAPSFDAQGTVSFRWERITVRQALAALLDNYELVMIEDPATSVARITQKTEPERKQP